MTPYSFLSLSELCNWIADHNLVEYFFGEQTHPEILKRTNVILGFLAENGALKKDDLDLIWNFATSEVINTYSKHLM